MSNPFSCSRKRERLSKQTPAHGKRVGYEYERNGTASIFMFAEPLASFRQATARPQRTDSLDEFKRKHLSTPEVPEGIHKFLNPLEYPIALAA